jgi:hypothetical protein
MAGAVAAAMVAKAMVEAATAGAVPIQDAAVMAGSAAEQPTRAEVAPLAAQCGQTAAAVIASRLPAEAIPADTAAVA